MEPTSEPQRDDVKATPSPEKPVSGNAGNLTPGGKKGARKPNQLLRDLRHVYQEPESEDETDGQKKLRGIWRDNYPGFLDRLQRAEQAHRAGAGKAVVSGAPEFDTRPSGPEVVDVGEEKALATLVAGLKSRAWNMATCPDCGKVFDMTKGVNQDIPDPRKKP